MENFMWSSIDVLISDKIMVNSIIIKEKEISL